jgi:hypothetical protein
VFHSKLLLHSDILSDLRAINNDHVERKLAFTLRRLVVYGRTPVVKSTEGVNESWLRSPLGGNGGSHYYLWWRHAQCPREGRVLFAAAVRHHDTHTPLAGRSLDDATRVLHHEDNLQLEEPWSEQQQSFLALSGAVVALSGYPGSGKTTSLWERIRRDNARRALYITWSSDLAAEARRWFGDTSETAFHPATGTIEFKSARQLYAEVAEDDLPSAPIHNLRMGFHAAVRKSRNGAVSRLPDAAINEAFDLLRGEALGSPEVEWRKDHLQFPTAVLEARVGEGVRLAEVVRALSLDRVGTAARHFPDLVFLQRVRARWESGEIEPPPLEYDLIAIDEVQDLTPLESALLLRMQAQGRVETRWLLAGDEGQTVRPSGFSWNALGAQVHEGLGQRWEKSKLEGSLRCPTEVMYALNQFTQFYSVLERENRPRLQRKPEDAFVSGQSILLGIATTAEEANAALGKLLLHGRLRVLCATDTAPLWIEEPLKENLRYPALAKGLEFPVLVLVGLGDALRRLQQASNLEPPPRHARNLVDQVRVAISRASGRLLVLEGPQGEIRGGVHECDLAEFIGAERVRLEDLIDVAHTLHERDPRGTEDLIQELRREAISAIVDRPELAVRNLGTLHKLNTHQLEEPPRPNAATNEYKVSLRTHREQRDAERAEAYSQVAFRLLVEHDDRFLPRVERRRILRPLREYLIGQVPSVRFEASSVAEDQPIHDERVEAGRKVESPSAWLARLARPPSTWSDREWLIWLRNTPSTIRNAEWFAASLESKYQRTRRLLDRPYDSERYKYHLTNWDFEEIAMVHVMSGRSPEEADAAVKKSLQWTLERLHTVASGGPDPSKIDHIAECTLEIMETLPTTTARVDEIATSILETIGAHEWNWRLFKDRPDQLARYALRRGQLERGLQELPKGAVEARRLLLQVNQLARDVEDLCTQNSLHVSELERITTTIWGGGRVAVEDLAKRMAAIDDAVAVWLTSAEELRSQRSADAEARAMDSERWSAIDEHIRSIEAACSEHWETMAELAVADLKEQMKYGWRELEQRFDEHQRREERLQQAVSAHQEEVAALAKREDEHSRAVRNHEGRVHRLQRAQREYESKVLELEVASEEVEQLRRTLAVPQQQPTAEAEQLRQRLETDRRAFDVRRQGLEEDIAQRMRDLDKRESRVQAREEELHRTLDRLREALKSGTLEGWVRSATPGAVNATPSLQPQVATTTASDATSPPSREHVDLQTTFEARLQEVDPRIAHMSSLWQISSTFGLKRRVVEEMARSALGEVPAWDAPLSSKQKAAIIRAMRS